MGRDSIQEVIVIGAGIAGLSAALHLAERVSKPLVLEAGDRVGGRLARLDPFEIGFYPPPKPTAAWIEILMQSGRAWR